MESRLLIALLLLAIVIISRGSHALSGEVPHYLAAAHSLLHDFDLDLTNQYDPNGDVLFRVETASRLVRPGASGGLYPSNGLGFSIALAPIVFAAGTVASLLPEPWLEAVRWNRERCARDLISLAIALLFAWLAVITLRVSRILCGRDTGQAWIVLLAFATLPLASMSILALPELPAALLTMWFVTERIRFPNRTGRMMLPLALLPWFDAGFTIITIAGLGWVAAGDWRGEHRARRALSSLALPAASIALLLASRWWTFGTMWPGDPLQGGVATRVTSLVTGLARIVADRDFGLLPVAPFWVLAIIAAPALFRMRPGYLRFVAGAAAGTLCVAALFGSWRAPGPPARAVASVLPLFVPLLSEGWFRLSSRAGRWAALAAATWALLLVAVVIDRPARAWTQRGTGVSRVPFSEAATLSRLAGPAARLERTGLSQGDFADRVRAGDVAAVRLFLDAGTDAAAGVVPAVQTGQTEVLRILLDEGAAAGIDGALALAWAAERGRTAEAGLLKQAGADINARNTAGATALVAAISERREEDIDILIRHGADLDAPTGTGTTALMTALAPAELDAALVARLIAAGADVNARDVDGWTPVHVAARAGHAAAVTTLAAAGANVDAMSRLGWTALATAVYDGSTEVVTALLAAGANPDSSSLASFSPLARAAARGDEAMVQALLRAGANPAIPSGGRDASAWAQLNGHADLAARLAGRAGP